MWFCSAHILIISILVIDMVEWKGNNISPTMVNAIGSLAPNDSDRYSGNVSRTRQLWSKNGIRSLVRHGRNADPLIDSVDLPSCIEICMVNSCYGVIPTYNTVAPTTAS